MDVVKVLGDGARFVGLMAPIKCQWPLENGDFAERILQVVFTKVLLTSRDGGVARPRRVVSC